jgi:hypothetical protein
MPRESVHGIWIRSWTPATVQLCCLVVLQTPWRLRYYQRTATNLIINSADNTTCTHAIIKRYMVITTRGGRSRELDLHTVTIKIKVESAARVKFELKSRVRWWGGGRMYYTVTLMTNSVLQFVTNNLQELEWNTERRDVAEHWCCYRAEQLPFCYVALNRFNNIQQLKKILTLSLEKCLILFAIYTAIVVVVIDSNRVREKTFNPHQGPNRGLGYLWILPKVRPWPGECR